MEPVRYGKGSNLMALMQTVLTDGDGPGPRWQTWLKEMWNERKNVANLYDVKHWSERTVIALVMQTLDNSITTYPTRIPGTKKWRVTSRQGHGQPNPTWIPIANKVVRKMAAIMGGTAGGSIGEPFNMPMTAHFIGGCAIGTSPENGVVDPYQRVYGHPGLHVADGCGDLGQPGREPVADDHRPGRARDVAVAQQGRARHAPGDRVGVRDRGAGGSPLAGGARVRSGGVAPSDRECQLTVCRFPRPAGETGR